MLAASIFEDIEKQQSWQSYTTLLFADTVVNREKEVVKSNVLTTKGNK